MQVGNRDAVILKLQTELDMAEQKQNGLLEELSIRDDEVQRLNAKIRQLQQDIKDERAERELVEERTRHNEKTINQQSHDYQMTLQEVSHWHD